ncbi:MAG: hypothetical protein V4736_02030 [Bdellovibrionota bacterium]
MELGRASLVFSSWQTATGQKTVSATATATGTGLKTETVPANRIPKNPASVPGTCYQAFCANASGVGDISIGISICFILVAGLMLAVRFSASDTDTDDVLV